MEFLKKNVKKNTNFLIYAIVKISIKGKFENQSSAAIQTGAVLSVILWMNGQKCVFYQILHCYKNV